VLKTYLALKIMISLKITLVSLVIRLVVHIQKLDNSVQY
jgi:hypothetical protein